MKRLIALLAVGMALMASTTGSLASQGSAKYGPINSGSTDSGTCGNDWANDTFKRKFTAATSPNTDGTYNVTEYFIAGRFVTIAGPSPNACDPTGIPGSTVAGGITGSFDGTFSIVVTGGTYDPSATCDAISCGTTQDFVKTVYGGTATYNVPTFRFIYHGNGPLLIQREWINADTGNSGDIRTS